jgi:hypothetical protein
MIHININQANWGKNKKLKRFLVLFMCTVINNTPLMSQIGYQPHNLIRQNIEVPVSLEPKTGVKVPTSQELTLYLPKTKVSNKEKTLSGACDADTIFLRNQDDIDNFADNYPDCKTFKRIYILGENADPAITNLNGLSQIEEITVQLLVEKTNLTTLAGLTGLKRVGIGFDIWNNPDLEETGLTGLESLGIIHLSNLPSLTSIAGLTNNFTNHRAGTVIISSTKLHDLSGLEGIHEMPNFYLFTNGQLTSLNGLQNLNHCPFGWVIWGNTELSDVSALSGLTSLDYGSMEFAYNYSLKDLKGLENIIFIKKHMWFTWNLELETLEMLNDGLVIEDEDNKKLKLIENWNLSFCSEPAICNFLNTGGDYEIENNSEGCNNIDEIVANCSEGCLDRAHNEFTGDENDDWHNPNNWSLERIPAPCDDVTIPEGKSVSLNGNVIISSLHANGADIEGNDYNMTLQNGCDLENTNFYNFNTLTIQGAEEVHIVYCNIEGNVKVTNAKNLVSFTSNNIYESNTGNGNVEIKDNPERINYIDLHGNYISGDLTLDINTNTSDAWTRISEDNDDEVRGSVTIKAHNRGGEFKIGKLFEGRLNIGRDLTLEAETTDYPMLSKIRFMGDHPSQIIKSGLAALEFEEIYFEKDGKDIYTMFNENITVTDRANFYRGLAIPAPGKKIIFERSSFVSVFSSESWVNGKVVKIGNTPFTFPVGNHVNQGVIGIEPIGGNDDMAFEANYLNVNPSSNGYDITQREPGLPKVSNNEYWELKQIAGKPVPNRKVMLRYDSNYSQKTNTYLDLRVAAWNGGKWVNKGVSKLEGDNGEAYATSDAFTTNESIFTLGYIPTRLPVVTVGNLPDSICRGVGFSVQVNLDTVMVGGNTFQVHLSQADGSFSSFYIIGQKTDVIGSTEILAFIPNTLSLGAGYKIRVVGISPALTSVNIHLLTIITFPQQPITIIGPNKVCLNSGTAKYYIQNAEPGASYNWGVNSAHATFTTNKDTVYVNWSSVGTNRSVNVSSFNQCGNGQSSSLQNITVANPAPTVSPSLTNSGRWIYASQHTPPQPGIGIRWYRNGNLISTATTFAYYAELSGNYTARFFSDCDNGPESNTIAFANNALPQTITFEALPNKLFGDAPFSLQATSSSGLPVSFTLVSGPGNLTAGVFTITGTGMVTIRASQAGNEVYDTAAYIFRSFEVAKASQTINFTISPTFSFPVTPFLLNGSASSGLPLVYESNTTNAYISSNALYVNAPGTISITARQPGNANYNAASPITQTACVRVSELTNISGAPFVCPGQTTTYSINNINGLTYSWRLSNGTTYAATGSSVNITWNTPGTYTLIVSAQGNCGAPTANDSLKVEVINAITPGAPGNLLPANNSTGLSLPLLLSWTAAANALTYDLYLWEEGTPKPTTPFKSNLTGFGYTLPIASLTYNKSYNWQVLSKNACLQTESVVQTFRLRPLPDLMVTQVNIPQHANSGQTVSISWTIKNVGPGNTTTNQSWTDAVFLSFDTFPNFTRPPQVQPRNWDQGEFPVRPLLVATRPNVTALNSGEQYSNSADFTIPENFDGKYYAYVITNFPTGHNAPQQMTVTNDTLKAAHPLQVTPSPTPDLRVENVVVPSTTFSGSTISVNYRVKNYGVIVPLPAKWTDKIYISPSPLFNSNNAILLKQPKANGTYYPNAEDASFDTIKQLEKDAFIDIQCNVVIPNFIQGTWFIHVQTNATQSIYEGPLANNNINNTTIQILLTPTPGFIVNNLNVPFSSASTTQPLSISYNIINSGFFDNRQRNKGHYYVPVTCAGGNGFRDSLGHGGSTWQDFVYLSSNPNGLNPADAILLASPTHGTADNSTGALRPDLCPATGITPTNLNTINVVRPGSNHPQSVNFNMPANLLPGTYYLYIHANAQKSVFEFPDTPVISRSQAIIVNRPDLAITHMALPDNPIAGNEINIAYTVKNNGLGGIFNAPRRDFLYVSNSASFDITNATLLHTQTITTNLAPNAETNHSFRHSFAPGTQGVRYLHIIINFDSTFRETNYGNNRTNRALNLSAATPADLVVSGLQLPDTLRAFKNNRFSYTVTNIGSASAIGPWTDNIYFSCSPTFHPSTAYLVVSRQNNRNLPPGASYTDAFDVAPDAAYQYHGCFGTNDETNVYVHVLVNANANAFEGNLRDNNIITSALKPYNNTHVDHVVTKVTGQNTGTVGRSYPVTWQVQNIGLMPTEGGSIYRYSGWLDGVYFSPDSVLNQNAVFAGWKLVNNRLNTGQSYLDQTNVVVPKLATGQYYVHVITDVVNSISCETNKSNNSNLFRKPDGEPIKVTIEQLPLPDLVPQILSAPVTAATGQPIEINFRIANNGVGPTFPNTWTENIWLSSDLIPNNGNDLLLSSRTHTGGLQVGNNYLANIAANIPLNVVTGNYMLILQTDAGNAVIELTEENNLAFSPIAIFTPPGSDLIVQQVTHPDTAWLGYPLNNVDWQVQNISAFSANGVSADGIYLSKTDTADDIPVLQGVLNKSLNLPPLASQSFQLAPTVSGVTEGFYNLLIRTDLLNNIPETDKTNNLGQSGKTIFIGVKPLRLNVPELNTLQKIERYYKMNIPDSLMGSTILVTLKTPDSLSLKNELYAGAGYVPTAARFDHRFNIPNSGNQTLLIESAKAVDYYIMIRSASPNPPMQSITLTAVKLPFAILTIQSNSGGNGGNVTVKINGSLFEQGMTARLSKTGTTIEATKVFFVSGGTVYATFPLQGKPLGLYHISLHKTDGSIAELPNSFSVVAPSNGGLLTGGGINSGPNKPGNEAGCDPGADAGLNSQLVTELVYPAKVFNGQTFPVQIKFTNPTNMDIPAPTRVLYNDLNLKMNFTIGTITNGSNPIVLQLTETGGPPGIIRAGGSGSVTIYCRAPLIRGIVFVNFTIQ